MKRSGFDGKSYNRTLNAIFVIILILMQLLVIFQPLNDFSRLDNRTDNERRNIEKPNDIPESKSMALSENAAWVPLVPSAEPGTIAGSNVLSSDSSGIVFTSHFYGFWFKEETINGSFYDDIEVPGASTQLTPGNPAVPWMTEFLEIPHGVDVNVSVTDFDVQFLEDYMIVPTQNPNVGLPEPTIPVFVKNETTYGVNSYYPEYNVTCHGEIASSPIIIRERRLLEIGISPIQFNPFTGRIRAYSRVEIRLNYSQSAEIEQVDSAFYSEVFESIFQDIILNYEEGVAPTTSVSLNHVQSTSNEFATAGYPTDSVDYLIITDPLFYPAAKKLADWKTTKGVFTRVFSTDIHVYSDTSMIFDNPASSSQFQNLRDRLCDKIDDMKRFIKEKYYELKPKYALLFGDTNHIPSDYNISHPATFYQNGQNLPIHGPSHVSNISSDVPYFCVRGSDFFPDIAHGRISVETIEEANSVVDRILAYEQEPPEDGPFYSDVLVTSYFQDWYDTSSNPNPDGREDEEFVQTSLNISDYIRGLPYLVQYKTHINFTTDTSVTPNYLYDGITPVPSNIDWTADTSDIINNLNEGRFLVYHIDHGTSRNFYWYYRNDWPNQVIGLFEGWGAPYFTVDEFEDLNNQDRLPLILSMDCNTGWFDGETDGIVDEDQMNQYQYDCFAEEITRMSTGGAIAVIASTRVSYCPASADLSVGITNSFWPGIVQRSLFFARPFRQAYNMGAALYRGKIHIAKLYAGPTDSKQQGNTTQLVYHLFGDPETPLWTQSPRTLTVEYPTCVNPGDFQSITVRVNHWGPVFNAKVCLEKNGEVYLVGYTDLRGEATFEIESLSVGLMNITVSKPNYIPHISQISVEIVCPIFLLLIGAGLAILIAIVIFAKKKK